uniref:Ubiquitin-like domain-containing protein n=1 Tax=Chromera velia CCMP2878 TaxID=1169474 RepID=A0A0G4I5M7_9ALVE|eukprot:Cvel_11180.t1-p1 / transcript=Cvel_11180.t1 / gene=Cvel_11180 / organism=Chromera_velia_CCMP2878 / gene_product=hypothetical protein / transcript_product=hypothetical protein / location=Cvel_scaffold694:12768-14704(+) / protein_length=214 / sequence_SO=supercontig / SO=protein_coding / is_pseudo=false
MGHLMDVMTRKTCVQKLDWLHEMGEKIFFFSGHSTLYIRIFSRLARGVFCDAAHYCITTCAEQVKVKIQEREGVPIGDQRLIFAGKQPKDNQAPEKESTLQGSGLAANPENSRVHLLGGSGCGAEVLPCTLRLIWCPRTGWPFGCPFGPMQWCTHPHGDAPMCDHSVLSWAIKEASDGRVALLKKGIKKIQDCVEEHTVAVCTGFSLNDKTSRI